MIVIFIGPPLAGKGTQAKLLGESLSLPVFSIGQLIRQANENQEAEIVEAFKEYSLQGKHLPIHIKFNLLKKHMDNAENGFILENFPATKEDLEVFNDYLNAHNKQVDKVFLVDVSREEMHNRMEVRGRVDDTDEIVGKRRSIQDQDRIPVIAYYKEKGLLEEINGEGEKETVHNKILSLLEK